MPRSTLPASANLPQPREVVMPDFTSNTFAAFSATITGDISLVANMLAIWSPRETRFTLRGGYILVLCTTNLAGAGTQAILSLFDEAANQPVLPLGIYAPAATLAGDPVVGSWPAGTAGGGARLFCVPWEFDLGRGYRSLAKNNRLLIGGGAGIGGGALRCAGLIWGVQE